MLQVTFRDVIPSAQLAVQVSAAYAALRAQQDARVSQDLCLRVTLSQGDAPESRLYVAVVELVNAAGAITRAETCAHQMTFALRSALSVVAAGPLAGLVHREHERRVKVQERAQQPESSPILACANA